MHTNSQKKNTYSLCKYTIIIIYLFIFNLATYESNLQLFEEQNKIS